MNVQVYASKLGIELYKEYLAPEAAKLCGVGVNTLRKAKLSGEINFLQIGEKKYKFLGVDLIQWKLQKRRIVSEITTSQKIGKENGVEPGMTSRPSSEGLKALAQATFSRPSKH